MDSGDDPTTEHLHLTERFSRPHLKTLEYEVTIDDPGAYTKPWFSQWTITEKTASRWNTGSMFEYIREDAARQGAFGSVILSPVLARVTWRGCFRLQMDFREGDRSRAGEIMDAFVNVRLRQRASYRR
ncbi:MAG: hypothetical protein ABSG41_25015 [Bryobacteraceae bacterium]